MTSADLSMTAFALLNGARIIAYVPQIICIRRDYHRAASVSLLTWGLFTLANLATISYALIVSGDRLVAGVFALNTLGCSAIFALTLIKRVSTRPHRHVPAHRSVKGGSGFWTGELGARRADCSRLRPP